MAADLMAETAVGETEETFGLKCVPAGTLVRWLCVEGGICRDDDRGAVIDAATFSMDEGLRVTDSYGRTFRLNVEFRLVNDAADYANMEPWRKAFRKGFLPALRRVAGSGHYRNCLKRLEVALDEGDCRLIRGATVLPTARRETADCEPKGACLMGLAGWLGGAIPSPVTSGSVEEFFAHVCYEMDRALEESAGCRHLLNWFDETDRSVTTPLLLAELERAMSAPAF